MAAHVGLKKEFTEDEKYHNLMIWLIFVPFCSSCTIDGCEATFLSKDSLNRHIHRIHLKAAYKVLLSTIPMFGHICEGLQPFMKARKAKKVVCLLQHKQSSLKINSYTLFSSFSRNIDKT